MAGVCTGPGPCDTTPMGTGDNWVTKVGGLPLYIRAIAQALRRSGHSESQAIQLAVGTVKRWAAGEGNVTAETRTRAAAAVAEWERKKAQAHVTASGAPMADRHGIELARVGHWDLTTGPLDVTPAMLHDAARRATEAGQNFRAGLRLGHTDPRFDGEPALGWLHNLTVEGDGDDTVLKGDVTGMPGWLADLEPTAYPDRSVEGLVHKAADGTPAGFEVTGLALLGVTPPGMTTLRSLRDLPAVLGVNDAPMPVAAAFKAANDAPEPTAGEIAAALTETPAEPPVHTPTPKEADTMSDTETKGLRERLGLAEDADEATLNAKVDELLELATKPTTPVTPEPPAIPEGSVVINGDALEELKIAAAAGQEARAVQLRTERDTTIAEAVKAGKIAPARREHWTTQWDKDPEGAKAAIGELDAVFPVAAAGYVGAVEDLDDEDSLYKQMFGDTKVGA